MPKIDIRTRIATEDLLDFVSDSLTPDEVVEFITELDKMTANWNSTLKLCAHFEKLKKQYKDEV